MRRRARNSAHLLRSRWFLMLIGALLAMFGIAAAGWMLFSAGPPHSNAAPPGGPEWSKSLSVIADYGQIYIYDPQVVGARLTDQNANVFIEALNDGQRSRRFVGEASGLVDLLTPGQWNFHTPMLVEGWPGEPPDDSADWDHVVDIDLPVPSGHLVFEGSGGAGQVTTDIPPGRYRARVSGRGFTQLGAAGAEGGDSYRLRVWPSAAQAAPVLRKSWPGWAAYR